MRSTANLSLCAYILAASVLAPVVVHGASAIERHQGHEVASQTLIVKFKPGFRANLADAMLEHDLDHVEVLTRNKDLILFHSRSKNVAALLRDLGAVAGIAYVEPN